MGLIDSNNREKVLKKMSNCFLKIVAIFNLFILNFDFQLYYSFLKINRSIFTKNHPSNFIFLVFR
jgi:hypothetical protein